jgi:hypothetical protein
MPVQDPTEIAATDTNDIFSSLANKSIAHPIAPDAEVVDRIEPLLGALTLRLYGFDLQDRPLVTEVPDLLGEIVPARTAIPLVRAQVGASVVAVFERGDRRRPIVLGVVYENNSHLERTDRDLPATIVQSDGERLTISAEREIVLRCGDATISLTRAGKVVIKGKYIISRSSGYNRIKGAAVDIN